ncbi:folate-Biopterin Transporter (FBT) family [Phytophthora infestans T30-4]|uniref:Folate-Biopterin Transporter (FBT) family n=1 Tax=Phytophthora infestans (strain T30-4) TaxID=403677 RepID=D0NFR5_PHYIT|nr:folate-Biopterin Transporter (FBT) family [Phytophthora infestans T30-4]EEY57116.1 folate-Biopterin Transporter (FBT) family [Phytophthora infestans T30-4]|eukprot:XP_002901726.1 folate-Biopterin Transporter (FBT) family [Phytophthora infestans T30-4]
MAGPTKNPESAVRLSLISANSQPKDLEEGDYVGVKTPEQSGYSDHGALRPGGDPTITSRANIGLLYQYAVVGFISGVLPSTIYPLLQMYLNLSLPSSFKVFFGILSDCFPIFGNRRRPYMVIGWSISVAMLLVMACMPIGDPYYTEASDRYIEARINYDAPSEAGKYVILMFFAAVGYVLSDASADAIMAGLAQQESFARRGKLQTMTYTVQTFVTVISYLLVGFCFNGEEYGGNFDYSLSFPELMGILTVLTAPTIPITWIFIKEDQLEVPPDLKDYMVGLWNQICKRAVFQVIAALFFYTLICNISYTAYSPIQSYMVNVTPINSTLGDALSYLFYMFGMMATSRWGLHWNWRVMIIITGIILIVIDGTCNLLIVWNVYRSQWFWLGPPIVAQLPNGISFMVSTLVIVELIGEGYEGAMYGLMTTISGIASSFATSLTVIINNPFNITNERVQEDDHSIHVDITYTIIIAYSAMVVSWIFLLLLPKQKRETQELLRTGGSNKLLGGLTIFYLSFSLVWAVMVNVMAIFDSTSCLVIAGGDGC